MDTLIVYPQNIEELAALKVVMRAMKISYETKIEAYPKHVVKGINESIQQANDGNIVPFTGIRDMLINI